MQVFSTLKKITIATFSTIVYLNSGSLNCFAQAAGDDDIAFNVFDIGFGSGDGANNTVRATAVQADGKIIVAGDFTYYNRTAKNRLMRLNTDGTIDATFNIGTGANDIIRGVLIQSDGKIIIYGNFTTYNGGTKNHIARVNSDGSADAGFSVGTGPNGSVLAAAIQADGKILIGGGFNTWNGAVARSLVRVSSTGSADNTFITGVGFNGIVNAIAVQTADQKIIVGGDFTTYNNGINANRIIRLGTDGTRDAVFDIGAGTTAGLNGLVTVLKIQADGKIIAAGDFNSYNGTANKNRIVRVGADGSLDATFTSGTGFDNIVRNIAVQSDGKLVVVGNFTTYNGTASNHIARLDANGVIDATFISGTGSNGILYAVSIQSDGKIIIGGDFGSYNATIRNCVARLAANGTYDLTTANVTEADGTIWTNKIQTDGKIIIGGSFTAYNGTASSRIARLLTTGLIDPAFVTGTGANGDVYTASLQADGKIIIGGLFNTYNGTTANYIARLTTTGAFDATFTPGVGANLTVYATAVQTDQKIIAVGTFTTYNGTSINKIARINTDGTLDGTFTVGTGFTGPSAKAIAIQSDGKILVGGDFTSYNGTTSNSIVRITSTGAIDNSFTTAMGSGPNSAVRTISIQSDGKIIIGGDFTAFNGVARSKVARLNADGSLDTSFDPGTGADLSVYTSLVQSTDGKILIGGNFTSYNGTTVKHFIRLNTDGTLNSSFKSGGTGANNTVTCLSMQTDSKIIVGGLFTSYEEVGRNRITRVLNSYINTSAVTPLSYCPGADVSVSCTVGGTFNTGNIFTIQMSDSDGVFSAFPYELGSKSATAATTITGKLPWRIPPGTGYRIRVVSTNLEAIGTDNGTDITVLPAPQPTIVADGDLKFCQGNTINLDAGAGFTSYDWRPYYEQSQTIPVSSTEDYYVFVGWATNACLGVSDTAEVTVLVPLVITSDPISDNICSGDTAHIDLRSNRVGTTFSWTVSQTLATGGASGSGILIEQGLNTTIDQQGTVKYFINAVNGTCSDKDTLIMKVNPLPEVHLVMQDHACSNSGTITLSGGTPLGGIYSGAGVNSNASTFKPSQAGLGTHDIVYSVTNNATGCIGSDTVQVLVEDCNVGIGEYELLSQLTLAPNPTEGVLMLSIPAGIKEDIRVDVTDMQGKVLISNLIVNATTSNQAIISLENLSNGMYFVGFTYKEYKSNIKVSVIK